MPPAETALKAGFHTAPPAMTAALAGWGGGPKVPVALIRAQSTEDLTAAMSRTDGAAITRGMGRSYGDAAQLRDGVVLDVSALRTYQLDAEAGVVTAQAGATLAALLAGLAPAGWVLPVVPGTQHVSVGGAIASDIHGKNHGSAGTFGAHVLALGLMSAGGEVLELRPDSDSELMSATIGGMGLTGVILWAKIKLRRLPGASVVVDSDRVESLDDALALLDGPGGEHRVAWLDLLSHRLVRGVVTRADPFDGEPSRGRPAASVTVPARVTVPQWWPGGLLAPSLVRAFNELRFRGAPRRQLGHVESFGSHMFPLDGLSSWPRLYGRAGFVQYQFVVPRGGERVLEQVIVRLRNSAVPCYLAVLKDFGAENTAPLSFPLAGWTLTLDMPRTAPGLEPLMSGFDELVAGAGGRVYLAKDCRLRPEMLEAMYPRLEQWRAVRDRADPERRWSSDLELRTGLVQRR